MAVVNLDMPLVEVEVRDYSLSDVECSAEHRDKVEQRLRANLLGNRRFGIIATHYSELFGHGVIETQIET